MSPSSLAQSWMPSTSSSSSSFGLTASTGKTDYGSPETSPDRASMSSDGTEEEDEDDFDGFGRTHWQSESSPESDSPSDDDSIPKFSYAVHPATPPSAPSVLDTAAGSSSSPNTHPYRPQRRPIRGLSPLTPANKTTLLPAPPAVPPGRSLPKSQPLARALFARIAQEGGPHAGSAGASGLGQRKKHNGPQKMIVPTKAFKTTFELGLTSSELARRA